MHLTRSGIGDYAPSLDHQPMMAKPPHEVRAVGLREATLNDPARLAAVHATGLLDSDVEEVFDRLTRLAVRQIGRAHV